jgi:hypothetical protein
MARLAKKTNALPHLTILKGGYESSLVPDLLVAQAHFILRLGLVILFLSSGIDKLLSNFVHWDQYVLPFFPWVIGASQSSFITGVGIAELSIGLGLAFMPEFFSALASLWLLGIVFNLLSLGTFPALAVRDFALAITAFALGPISRFHLHKGLADGQI